ncbi:MAG: pantoate--beta-alanine ligase [Chloroflexota bacterium]|nr:pantoate--beta-alanine ligase [Chloroflexota bacterium]
MRTITRVSEYRDARKKLDGAVGFVPTMGYLHEGHLELVRWARRENNNVVVSIFVNPTQFGPGEDFEKYPRDPDRDLALLENEKVDIVLYPQPDEVYPAGFNTWVEVLGITERLEGKVRPGHFKGVATVVAKLFNIVNPDCAYFGQKDAQQVAVIQKMVSDLNMDLRVIVVPTVREPDGLAMSSRNTYLNKVERQAALVLWRSLNLARDLHAGGESKADSIKKQMEALIGQEPLAAIDYVSIADITSLEEVDCMNKACLVSLAVRIGRTRLIDNIILGDQ